jgi:ureidoglycolate dehydrogenase (NAD+)
MRARLRRMAHALDCRPIDHHRVPMQEAPKVIVAASQLRSSVAAILRAKGMREVDAATLADVIVWADLRGVSSHGVQRLPMFLRIIDTGEMDPTATPTIESKAGAVFVVDGHKSAGPVAMKIALDEGERRAKSFGVGLGVMRGATHTGAIGYYASKAAERGLAVIMLNGGPPNMAYHGARVASLATSPIAIGAPATEGPLVLDMATATIANGRLQQAIDLGQSIPAGSALTKDGAPTTDAAAADILLPLGGPKGSGLSFMIECLTGVLVARPLLISMIGEHGNRAHVHNAMLIVIDIAAFRPLDDFKRDMSALGALVKSLPRLDPDAEILLPGERGAAEYARRMRDGVPVSAKAWKRLLEIAASLGVAVPNAMA